MHCARHFWDDMSSQEGDGWSYDTHLLGVAKVRARFWDALGVALFRHFLQRL